MRPAGRSFKTFVLGECCKLVGECCNQAVEVCNYVGECCNRLGEFCKRTVELSSDGGSRCKIYTQKISKDSPKTRTDSDRTDRKKIKRSDRVRFRALEPISGKND